MKLKDAHMILNGISGIKFKKLFSPKDMKIIILNKGKTGQLLELSQE